VKVQWYKLEHTSSGEVNVGLTALDFDTTVSNNNLIAGMPFYQPFGGRSPLLSPIPTPPLDYYPPPSQILPPSPLTKEKVNETELLKTYPSDTKVASESHTTVNQTTLRMFRPNELEREFPHIAKVFSLFFFFFFFLI
jgi:hypothetical protein